jgi:hypothetical protein
MSPEQLFNPPVLSARGEAKPRKIHMDKFINKVVVEEKKRNKVVDKPGSIMT